MSEDEVVAPMSWRSVTLKGWSVTLVVVFAAFAWRSACVVPLLVGIPIAFWWLERQLEPESPNPRGFYLIEIVLVVLLGLVSALGPIGQSLVSTALGPPYTYFQF